LEKQSLAFLRLFVLNAAWLLAANALAGQPSDAPVRNDKEAAPLSELAPADLKLIVGEHLIYDVRVNGVPAGKAQFDVRRAEPVGGDNGPQVWVATMELRSNRAVSLYFEVKNKARSLIDCKAGFSRFYHCDRNEGQIDAEERVSFKYDYADMEALYERPRTDGTDAQAGQPQTWVARKIPLTGKALDPLSAMYYLRSIDFSKQSYVNGIAQVLIPICADRRVWNTKIIVHQPQGEKETFGSLGERAFILIEPQLEFDGLFQRKGGLTVWLDAETRIPLKAKVEIAIGSAEVLLCEHESVSDASKGYSPFKPGSEKQK
jgi:hypothetical protein